LAATEVLQRINWLAMYLLAYDALRSRQARTAFFAKSFNLCLNFSCFSLAVSVDWSSGIPEDMKMITSTGNHFFSHNGHKNALNQNLPQFGNINLKFEI
jgi:hypothetical protein